MSALHQTDSHSPQIGKPMSDGTVFAGSLDGKDIFAAPKDAPLTYTFNEAAEFAQQLNREKYLGHDNWRVPDKGELNVLFNNRAAIGGFNESGSSPAAWYWSSSQSAATLRGSSASATGARASTISVTPARRCA